jgi:hypothetical protein
MTPRLQATGYRLRATTEPLRFYPISDPTCSRLPVACRLFP